MNPPEADKDLSLTSRRRREIRGASLKPAHRVKLEFISKYFRRVKKMKQFQIRRDLINLLS
jgi:hypothetical protein